MSERKSYPELMIWVINCLCASAVWLRLRVECSTKGVNLQHAFKCVFCVVVLVALAVGVVAVTEAHAAGTTYYVSSLYGNDNSSGTSTRRPWKTLGKVSSMVFQPNDCILLQRGNVWNGEELILRGSGNLPDGAWITLGAYGRGARPRITNPPYDMTPGLVDWTAVNKAYPGTDRYFMRIAVRIDVGSAWSISGLEIDNAEMGIYIPGGGAGYNIEDMHFHDILGLFMPPTPGWPECIEHPSTTFCMWEPFPSPSWGSAIYSVDNDYVTIRDVFIERATGGIEGFGNRSLVENVLIDKVTSGGANFHGHGNIIRYVTILNGQWPEPGAWYGADPFILWDTGSIFERNEVAYTRNYGGLQDSSPLDADADNVGVVLRDNFFHNNDGSCFEFNLAGENHRILIEDNICYNNGLEDEPSPDADYLKAAFAADACGYYPGATYTIRDNIIYKTFPGQHLNHYFHLGGFDEDFSIAQQDCGYEVSNNTAFEIEQYTLPLPIPAPPPVDQVNIAPAAQVRVSSSRYTASLAKDDSLDTEWVSNERRPWIRYVWSRFQTIDRIRLFDRSDLENWATSGILTFSDGSRINVTGGILNNGAMREVILDYPKRVTWVQFTVTRTMSESPGTHVGLSEFQVFQAGPTVPPPPPPDPGTFMVDFEDRPYDPTLLTGQYPDDVNGIDWDTADWTTGTDANDNRYLYVDFPRYNETSPASAGRIFILPPGKALKSISVSCPEGAVTAFSQVDQRLLIIPCDGTMNTHETGWSLPLQSNIVGLWIDLTNTPDYQLNDVSFDNIEYGD